MISKIFNFIANRLLDWSPVTYFWIQRSLFVGDERRTFFLQLSMLMRNGLMGKLALLKLVEVYGNNDSNPHSTKAVVAKECLDGLGESATVPDTLYEWVPYDEYQVINAAMSAKGGIAAGLQRAADLVERKGRMRGVLIAKLSNPAVQFVSVLGLLYYISSHALPQMLKMTKPDQWDFSAWMMAMVAEMVGNYGLVLLGAGVVLVLFMIWSIPNLTGVPRLWVEPIPPWSIVRETWGATFLYNYALLQSSGKMGKQILLEGIETANPYMAERMLGALTAVKNGKNIGEALHLAGYNFPSRAAVQFTRAIAGQEGGQEALMQFTTEWMDETVRKVSALADTLNVFVMLFNFTVLISVLMGASSIGMTAINAIGTH
jgi:type II secretory pathway component PulF